MANGIYKYDFYKTREVRDIRDLLKSSTKMYKEHPVYLVKDKPGGVYRPISYIEFDEMVDCLGTALMELGLTGKKIAVIGENRYEWVLSYMAVTNGTGVVVPLDRELPQHEIKNLLQRSGVSAVIYSGKVEMEVQEAARGVDNLEYLISMDAPSGDDVRLSLKELLKRGRRLLDEGKRYFIDAEIDPEEMRIILYTSGTTGLAKGVMLCHRNIVANVRNMSRLVNVKNFIGLSVLPMHHTYEFTCHILTAMYQGCSVAICEGLKYIVKNMAEARASVLIGVPLIFESMHKKVWKQAEKSGKADKLRKAVQVFKKLNKINIKSSKKLFKDVHQALGGEMKLLITGAAAIDPNVIDDFNAMGFNMIQGYGMTENAPIIAVNPDRYHKAAAVGPPMPGTQIRIHEPDESGVGEVVCKGDSVMLGYYEDPEETEKVLKDGWLYTGDYGCIDKDGFLYISGRKKNVIVTKNGKNIFPEEVEYYLKKNECISEVIVTGFEDQKTGETIVHAEIYPDFEYIEEVYGSLAEGDLKSMMKKIIDDTNDQISVYKRVKRFKLRNTDFEKTTTKKVKRTYK